MKENLVYMLCCSNHHYYTGWTNDFIKRMSSHQKGTAAHYTRAFVPKAIVYIEVFETRSEAMRKEAQIKKMTRSQKEMMIHEHEASTSAFLKEHPFQFE
ncbi:MAG: GIY-YIG nuclease family protein [Erysipelotrichaceae bacterium]|nr:GIY-YIG nuclease family protein [Erysipelotrichaceae bacterium]